MLEEYLFPVIVATSKYIFRAENDELRRENALLPQALAIDLLPNCLEEHYNYRPILFCESMLDHFQNSMAKMQPNGEIRTNYPRAMLQTDEGGRAIVCTAYLWHMHCIATTLWQNVERRELHVPPRCFECRRLGVGTCECGWGAAYVRGCEHLEEHYHPDELVALVREAALSAGRSHGLACSLGVELNAADWPELEWPFAGGVGIEYEVIGGEVMRRPARVQLVLGAFFLFVTMVLIALALMSHPVA